MKSRSFFFASLLLLIAVSGLRAQTTLYWDSNDSTAGAGTAPSGTWGTDTFWSTDSAGLIGTTAWVDSSTAVFAAGTDAVDPYNITVTGTQTAAAIKIEEGAVDISGGNLVLTNGTIDVAASASASVSTAISSTVASIKKTGAGTLTLTGNNDCTNIVVGGGVLSIPGDTTGASNPLGAYPGAATSAYLTVSNRATLRSTATGIGGDFVSKNRGILLGNNGAFFDIADSTPGNYLVYAGIITGSGTLTKKGPGTYCPTNANTYTGNTTNLEGTILIPNGGFNSVNIFGNPSSTLVLAGGTLTHPFDFNRMISNKFLMTADTIISGAPVSNYRAVIFNNTSIATSNGTLSILNVGSASQYFQVRFTNGGFNFTRPISIGTNGRMAQLDFFSDNFGATAVPDQIFSGLISGPGTVRRSCNGNGTGGNTIVSAMNTYSGGTFINGGFIGFGIDSTNYPVTAGPLGTGPITIGSDPSDGFYASGGARSIGNDITFGTGTNLTIKGANALTLYGTFDLGTKARGLFITNSALTTISGPIIGTGTGTTFTNNGTGTLVFSGANTYSGNTLVKSGKLLVNNVNASATSSGTVTVNAGATFGGNGLVAGAITDSGNLAPGVNGIGLLTPQNGLNMAAGKLLWELGALRDDVDGTNGIDFDQVSMGGGTLTLGGSSALNINFTTGSLAPDFATPFWQTTHKWTVIKVNGNPNTTAFTTVQTNAFYYAGTFSSVKESNGDISLTFTPSGPTAPIILSPMANKIVGEGTNAVFTVSATGTAPLSYQWFYNSAPISGSNAASFTVVGPTTAQAGSYSVEVSNGSGTNSASATLTVIVRPAITTQPQSKTIQIGDTVNLSVVASGTTPFAYQWKSNTVNLAGSTNATYSIINAQTNQSAAYTVVLTNFAGSATSSNAYIAVSATPITPPLVSLNLNNNGTLLWNSVSNRTYRAQFLPDLGTTNWTDIPPDVVSTGAVTSRTNSNAAATNRFYRVIMLP
ncbi:MAG: hypothetical protein JWM68_4151 [Verrucomicrobiales bacterium]|nr:hypothetical protein [Verrucomicrobiales bacterium]